MSSYRKAQFFSTLRSALAAWLLVATFADRAAAEPVDNTDASRGGPAYSVQHLLRLHRDADQGSALAQYLLGALYQLGEVLPQDHAEAAKWFRRAADQGLAVAQFALGGMYAVGHGVPEDIVHAHKWLNLAAARAAQIAGAQKLMRDAQEMRGELTRKMSARQIDEAEYLAREWKPKSER
jgi:TPR repeat protein